MFGVVDFLLAVWNTFVVVLQTLAILCIAAVRFPIRATCLVTFTALSIVAGLHAAVSVVFYGSLGLILWNVLGRVLARTGRLWLLASYRGLIGTRLRSAWRRWRLYERRWQRTLAGQHLTRIIDNGYDDVPKLGKVTVTPAGDTIRVKVLPGQTVQDFVGLEGGTARALAKAFRARECRVTDIAQTDYVTLELPRGDDPLADTVPFPGVPASTADVDLRRVPIGVDERGRTITVPIHGSHVLVAGQTGAGKGSVFWSIILHLEPFIREGSVVLVACDPKRGVELNPGRRLFTGGFADTDDQIQTLLAKAVTTMDDNSDYIKGRGERKLTPTPERPLYVIFVDELGRLAADKACKESIRTLINVGRGPGVSFVGATQNATKEIVQDRDEIPVKICLRLENLDSVRKILGRTAYAAGARAEEIPLSLPGVGYVKVDKAADDLEDARAVPRWLAWFVNLLPWTSPVTATVAMTPTRFRAFHVTDEMIEEANARFAPDAAEPEPEVDGEREPSVA
jgi:S-DNA-T family DNA segregation ATPase FtsK/SpoIIIE